MVLLWCIGLSAIIPEAGRNPPLCQSQKTFARKIDHRVRCVQYDQHRFCFRFVLAAVWISTCLS